jgi:hypothetical protein
LPSRSARSTSSDVSVDESAQPLRVALVAGGQLLELERLDAVDALEPDVLLRERDLELLAQDLRVEQILDADPEPEALSA